MHLSRGTYMLPRRYTAYTVGVPKADDDKSIRKVYPRLTPGELAQAENTLREYVALALRVFERIEEDPEANEKLLCEIETRHSKWEQIN